MEGGNAEYLDEMATLAFDPGARGGGPSAKERG